MLLQYLKISNVPDEYSIIFKICLSFELIFLITSACSYIVVALYMRRYQFHYNFKAIILVSMLTYVLDIVSRFIILLYEIGICEYEVEIQEVKNSLEPDPLFYLRQYLPPDTPIIVFISSVYRVCYMIHICSLALLVAAERYFATIWVTDYEKKKRKFIGIPISIANFIVGICGSLIFHFELINTLLLIMLTISLNFFSTIAFSFLYITNKKSLKNMSNRIENNKYTLSFRFQLNENMKVMRFSKYVLLVVAPVNTILALIFTISNRPSVRKDHILAATVAHTVFNCFLVLYGQTVAFVTVLGDKNVRKFFLKIRFIRSITSPLFSRCFPSDYGKKRTLSVNEETDIYFTSLASQWDGRMATELPKKEDITKKKTEKQSSTRKHLISFFGKKQSRVDLSTSMHE